MDIYKFNAVTECSKDTENLDNQIMFLTLTLLDFLTVFSVPLS